VLLLPGGMGWGRLACRSPSHDEAVDRRADAGLGEIDFVQPQ
jgi:hypothetical protein